jgi:FkbM family methyltransferase
MNKILEDIKKNTKFQGGAQHEDFQTNMFVDALSQIKTNNPVMIELGSNDCFYSILFNKFFNGVENISNICIEVSSKLIDLGISNIQANNCNNFQFKHSRIGTLDQEYFDMISQSDPNLWGNLATQTTSLKELINEFKLKNISILHMDIQGSEIFILNELLDLDIDINYIFVSTHVDSAFGSTHDKCLETLKSINFEILFSNPSEGGYGDGLIIAKK